MKNLILFVLLTGFVLIKSQVPNLTHIKLMKEDSTKQAAYSDTSYIYNAMVLTHTIGGITGFTLTTRTYDKQNSVWTLDKDTSYTWSSVSATQHANQTYVICKPNNSFLKVCLGRLDPAVRRKFIFKVTGSNGTLTKEFNF